VTESSPTTADPGAVTESAPLPERSGAPRLMALAQLRRVHPSYSINYESNDPERAARYVAVAASRDVHPTCVISTDLDELAGALDPRDTAMRHLGPNEQSS